MKDNLIYLLKKASVEELCMGAFDGLCHGIDCPDCPFHSNGNMMKLITELESLPTP